MTGEKLYTIFQSIVAPPGGVVSDDPMLDHVLAGFSYLADRLPQIRSSDLNRDGMAQKLYETSHECGDKFGRPAGCTWVPWAEWSTSYAKWAAAWYQLADMLVRGELGKAP